MAPILREIFLESEYTAAVDFPTAAVGPASFRPSPVPPPFCARALHAARPGISRAWREQLESACRARQYWKELKQAFPAARVILTHRDADSWHVRPSTGWGGAGAARGTGHGRNGARRGRSRKREAAAARSLGSLPSEPHSPPPPLIPRYASCQKTIFGFTRSWQLTARGHS